MLSKEPMASIEAAEEDDEKLDEEAVASCLLLVLMPCVVAGVVDVVMQSKQYRANERESE